MANEFKAAFTYAQANGFKGSFASYVRLQYDAYVKICQRQEISALSFEEWKRG